MIGKENGRISMYGVIIESGPWNWQVLQQKDGYADAVLSGRIEVEEEIADREDLRVVVYVTDENTNARITEPYSVRCRESRWKAEIRIPAGGPYRIETCLQFHGTNERRGARIFHIGVGDVYLISGQSNAAGVGRDCINDPVSPDVRLFRLSGVWDMASHPIHDTTDNRFPLSQEKIHVDHSPWLNFGKVLNRALGYPIGLIPGARGGLSLADWNREEGGKYFENALEIVRASGSEIKGIIWYQGCNDTSGDAVGEQYFERFKQVCADFRKVFGDRIPILTVQLNKYTANQGKDESRSGYGFSKIREAQRRAMHEIPKLYMVPSIDLMVCDGIHNKAASNMVIGERTANTALKYIYRRQIICDAPDIIRAVREDKTSIRLYFDHVYGAIDAHGISADKLMVSLTDEKGRITPKNYSCPGDNSMILEFEREIAYNASVSCDRYNDHGIVPCDSYSYLPVVPFSDIKIQD